MSQFQTAGLESYYPIPIILLIAGILLLALPFAGKFKGKLPVSKSWQKLAGFTGFVLLGIGLCLVAVSPMENAQGVRQGASRSITVQYELADPFGLDDLHNLKKDVAYLQMEALDALDEGHLLEAELAIIEAEDLIDYALSQSPGDSAVLNQDGCLHRNLATVYQRLSLNNQEEHNLGHAERSFRLMISFDSENADAWKSLGDVHILRDDLDRAEECVRKALDLNPDYEAARKDLTWILAHQ